jgi:dATP pyrophosphohydrolase
MNLARAPFQILVFPYCKDDSGKIQYAIFSRADYFCWQGIAGGGEDKETPLEAAKITVGCH